MESAERQRRRRAPAKDQAAAAASPAYLGQLVLDKDGKVKKLFCTSGARDDPGLRRWCGFDGTLAKVLYGSGEEVTLLQTWKDGALQKESPGASHGEPYREVWFKDVCAVAFASVRKDA
jgi:hypothetical protein